MFKVCLNANGKKYGFPFWKTIWQFFFVPNDGRIRCEVAVYADLKGKVLSREFYTFRQLWGYFKYMPTYILRKEIEQFARELGIHPKLASCIGAIAWVGATTSDTIEGGVSSNSFSYTVNAGANLCTIVGSGYADNQDAGGPYDISGITYNSVSFTQDATLVLGTAIVYIHHLVSPATGANTLSTTFAGTMVAADRGGQGAVTYSGVLQSGTLGITGTASVNPGTTLEVTMTTQTNNSWVFNCFWWGGSGSNAVSQGETERWNILPGVDNGGADKSVPTAGSTTTGWTGSVSNTGVLVAIEFKAATAVVTRSNLLTMKVG